jgi:hypothetical protein
MKIFFLALLLTPCTLLFSSQQDTLEGAVSDITVCSEIDHCSMYTFRGIVLNRNFVIQPVISVLYKNFSAGLWSNISTQSAAGEPTVSEYDIFVSHEFTLYGICINNTAAMYIFTGESGYPTTTEYMLKAEYYTGPIGYSTEFAVDIMEYPGAFIVTHGINYEKKFSEKLFLNTSITLSWAGSKYNFVNIGLEKKAFNFAGLDLSFTFYPDQNLYFKPHFQYNKLLDNELKEFMDDHNTFFGILTGYTF